MNNSVGNEVIEVTQPEEIRKAVALFWNNSQMKEPAPGGEVLTIERTDYREELVMPRSVSYSVLRTNTFGELIILEILRSLQPYMTNNPDNCYSSVNLKDLIVKINLVEALNVDGNHKTIDRAMAELKGIPFKFSYVIPPYVDANGMRHKKGGISYNGNIVTGWLYHREEGCYAVTVNPFAVPYLTFIGRGMGFIRMNYETFRNLSSLYSKRLYRLMNEWMSYGEEKRLELSELRGVLEIPNSWGSNDLKRFILDKTAKELVELKSTLQFTYTMKKESDNPKARGFSAICFHFTGTGVPGGKLKDKQERMEKKMKTLKALVMEVADSEMLPFVDGFCERIASTPGADRLMEKFLRYGRKKNSDPAFTKEHYRNTMLKIIRESYEEEFRSGKHVANSERWKRACGNTVKGTGDAGTKPIGEIIQTTLF